ncbi:Gfo/Idh/MocA family protein [Paenibacillus sp. N3.4]|uniref:Gfo/Idh/MocA family protein n=1 Tax=Paenibacillus sp. N3.4 TaxID=2603222 RepID=UPI0011CBFCC0|nr:Gfo/Idh/MocA family oxidoreductase [Paenibacillus sp. N3.4]TXK85046.1 Gfo/Idh/MocA family oxidoreductase [Paenibacillus sp. N3.4]
MKVAIVGCGNMGAIHANNIGQLPDVDFVGAFDVRIEAADRIASLYGTTSYTSFEKMMEEADPDLVCVLLQTPYHKEYVIKAAEYGKHVFCEKPIALTVSDAEEMTAFCESKGVKLFIGHVVRFFPNYADIKNRIDAGEIGKIGVAHSKRVGPHPGKASDWYNDLETSGGVIMDLMIHDIDFFRWTMGEVKTVYTLNYRNQEMDYALVTLRFENKSIANLEAFWGYPGSFRYSVEFAANKGLIRFDSKDANSLNVNKRISTTTSSGGKVAVPLSPSNHDPYYAELKHFIECIQTNKPLLVTPYDACKNVEIARAAIQSAIIGQPVHL